MPTLRRKSRFLGAKLRALRKRNGLTLDELSARCIQLDADAAPSVSYLSMIESGKRVPSEPMLLLLARVFQREPRWFFDASGSIEVAAGIESASGATSVPLEPAFLFSKQVLQSAIPELLSQTGTTGRQFAHLLIRTHQEMSRNDFPDLERAAESVGERCFPLSVDDLLRLCKRHGLAVRWFDREPLLARNKDGEVRSLLRSFFEAPRTVYLNRALMMHAAPLKFDLASHIGHKILHGGDGLRSPHATGGEMGSSPEGGSSVPSMHAGDVLHAWRDFECSFFADALLCPKLPFRRFLMSTRYAVDAAVKHLLTPSVVMRRMTRVSPYPHWHFFDAYPPGHLRAVYRGNGIPLPWGNLTQVPDPCPSWAVFRMINGQRSPASSQISVLRDEGRALLYCCHSIRTHDMAGNARVLSVGVDLTPALQSNGIDPQPVIQSISAACQGRGADRLPAAAAGKIRTVAAVLNIAWIEEALSHPGRTICPRSTRCPRARRCEGAPQLRAREIADVRSEILGSATRPR